MTMIGGLDPPWWAYAAWAEKTVLGRCLLGHGIDQHTGQARRRHLGHGCRIGCIDRLEQVFQADILARGNEVELGEIKEFQLALQHLPRLFAGVGIEAIPFVDGNDQRSTRLHDEIGDVGVLVGNIGLGIDHQDHDVGVLDGLQGLHHRKFLDRLENLSRLRMPAVSTSTYLRPPRSKSISMESRVVPGASKAMTRSSPSRVLIRLICRRSAARRWRRARHPNATRPLPAPESSPGPFRPVRAHLRRAQQKSHWFAQPEFMEISLDHAGIHALRLVDGNEDRTIDAAQLVGDFLVMRRQAGTAVDHENDGVGFGNRLLGLAGHFMQDAVLDQRLETAGIDNQIGLLAQLAVTVMAVAGQTRHVGNNGVT
jgi:hypothetical protein